MFWRFPLDALKASLAVARRQMREKLKDLYEEIRCTRTSPR